MKRVRVSTTHQTGTGKFLRQNAHNTKKYELKDKNINIWLGSKSFFSDSNIRFYYFSYFLFAFFKHVFLNEITIEPEMLCQFVSNSMGKKVDST